MTTFTLSCHEAYIVRMALRSAMLEAESFARKEALTMTVASSYWIDVYQETHALYLAMEADRDAHSARYVPEAAA